jgi:D-lactate dehydrogenase
MAHPPRSIAATDSLHFALRAAVAPDRVLTRPIDLVAFASDASFYRLMPRAVVLTRDLPDVLALFRVSRETRVPMTFRAAGSSLSGQAVSDGILVEVARHWRTARVEEEGRLVRSQPGMIGGALNAMLRRHGTKIGPDPASINTCTVGGIVANNSSGMCCGVSQNAYHTLASMTFALPSGTVIDTARADADEQLRAKEPALWAGLRDLKSRIESNAALAARIRAKYRMKNTTGYSLNAFLDLDRPVDIFQHLLVGSEGTLGFVAEVVLRTVPDLPVRYTGLLLFPDVHAACSAIVPFRDAGAAALELMDRASLRSVESQAGMPPEIAALPERAAGLLVEFQAADEGAREGLARLASDAVDGMPLAVPPRFTDAASEQAQLWRIRSGLFPSVGSVRRSGTTVIIEDVAFPVERLADAAVDLTGLFGRHGYPNAIVFGHAKDGNLHFVITQSFNEPRDVDQYARFMDEVVRLVVERYDGALKAEHGTGRNMAPFVETEWGPDALDVMRRLKALVDPEHLLNPGVILNANPRAHLADLKPLPPVEPEVDKCIECGYCEPACPTREVTLTPRQRIVVRREMARLDASEGDRARRAALEADYAWAGVDSCAADGLCAIACPVSIDTGQLVKRLRGASHSPAAQRLGVLVAERFWEVEGLIRTALRVGHAVQRVFGDAAMPALTRLASRALGPVPLWTPRMPREASTSRPATMLEGAAAIYVPSCLSRTMGAMPGEPDDLSIVDALVRVAARAGRPVHVPHDVVGTCCGVPFSSKGYDAGHEVLVNDAIERFWGWSDEGRLPIVIDTSPCTYGLRTCRSRLTPENQQRFHRLRVIDVVEYVHDLLPSLVITKIPGHVALHPVCSATKMNLAGPLQAIADACVETAETPTGAGCCAMAGDRGLMYPDLATAATAREAEEVRAGGFRAGYSSSRTCEVNLTRATGLTYRSIVFLVEEATRGGPTCRER